MNKEYLEEIQETIIRRIEMSKVMGGLTSSDKKFIDLWNYVIELQDKVNQLETNRDEAYKLLDSIDEYMLVEQHLKLVEAKKLLERGKE